MNHLSLSNLIRNPYQRKFSEGSIAKRSLHYVYDPNMNNKFHRLSHTHTHTHTHIWAAFDSPGIDIHAWENQFYGRLILTGALFPFTIPSSVHRWPIASSQFHPDNVEWIDRKAQWYSFESPACRENRNGLAYNLPTLSAEVRCIMISIYFFLFCKFKSHL